MEADTIDADGGWWGLWLLDFFFGLSKISWCSEYLTKAEWLYEENWELVTLCEVLYCRLNIPHFLKPLAKKMHLQYVIMQYAYDNEATLSP